MNSFNPETSIAQKGVAIIGLGLIGGSLALAIKQKIPGTHICAYDRCEEVLKHALANNSINQAISLSQAANCQLIILAVPVNAVAPILPQLQLPTDCSAIIMDTGSTKQNIIQAYQEHLPEHFLQCIPAHPIAGSENSGYSAAQSDLFEGACTVICDDNHQQTDPSLQTATWFWQRIGSTIAYMQSKEHDEIFAAISHLPHLLAYGLVQTIINHPQHEQMFNYAASGFRDFTRIASSHSVMWRDIFISNRKNLLGLIEKYQAQLEELSTIIKNQDAQSLEKYLATAKQHRDDWIIQGKQNES